MDTIRTKEVWKAAHRLSRLLHTISVKQKREPLLYTIRYQSVLVITHIIDAEFRIDSFLKYEQYHQAIILLTQIEYLCLLMVEAGNLPKEQADELVELIWQARHHLLVAQQELKR